MYKIPGRSIYCGTISQWIKEMFWVYVIMKVFRDDIAAISPVPDNPPRAE